MIASAARRAGSVPMPPHTSTASSHSYARNFRPAYSCSTTRQCLTSGRTSRSSAATIATLDISVGPEPIDRAAQRIVYRDNLPANLVFRLRRTRKHLLLPHPHRLDRRPRLLAQQTPGDRLIDDPGD